MESIKGNPHDPTLVITNRLICWKNLSMDFVTGLPMCTDWKGTSYDSIPTDENGTLQAGADNDRPGLAEVTIDVIVQYSDATCAGPPKANLSMDFMTGLPISTEGHQFWLLPIGWRRWLHPFLSSIAVTTHAPPTKTLTSVADLKQLMS